MHFHSSVAVNETPQITTDDTNGNRGCQIVAVCVHSMVLQYWPIRGGCRFTAEMSKSVIISAQEHARSLRWSTASRASPLQLKDDTVGRGELTSRLGPSLIVQSLVSPAREGISSLKGSFQILQPEISFSKGHFIQRIYHLQAAILKEGWLQETYARFSAH